MLLLVGLGNPGLRYENNRHNVGYMAVDDIVQQYSFGTYRSKFRGQVADGVIRGQRILVLKPETFMNESGQSVQKATRFYKIAPRNVIVAHDELDLAFGKLRFRTGGGLAGHNGLLSIQNYIGADFSRIRIGIGHPGRKELVNSHVLSDFSSAERQLVRSILGGISESIGSLVDGNGNTFMNKLAQVLGPLQKNINIEQKNTMSRKKD
ncbi:MAG: aminoacyl-tRNA hydrolase [Pseudomonadota bacterium]|nr:aminoacyl-tRNA hydrolase [Pseudomonadota bacterium]